VTDPATGEDSNARTWPLDPRDAVGAKMCAPSSAYAASLKIFFWISR
jgi:hypothetical protein